jgi:hypothetical protein
MLICNHCYVGELWIYLELSQLTLNQKKFNLNKATFRASLVEVNCFMLSPVSCLLISPVHFCVLECLFFNQKNVKLWSMSSGIVNDVWLLVFAGEILIIYQMVTWEHDGKGPVKKLFSPSFSSARPENTRPSEFVTINSLPIFPFFVRL